MLLERYGQFVVRRRRAILVVTLLGLAAGVTALVFLPNRLKYETFVAPGTESYEGRRILEREFGVDVPNLVLVVTARSGSVDDPAVVSAATATVDRLTRTAGISGVVSYWTAGRQSSLRGDSGTRALVVAHIDGSERDADRWVRRYGREFRHSGPVLDVQLGGVTEFIRESGDIIKHDLQRAELLTAPVTLVALLVIFGSVVAAILPLAIATIAVVGTAGVLFVLTEFAAVSLFSLFLTTIIGLGLALDYSLFVVSRFREELSAGLEPHDAVVRTVATAGRTVLFSASAVAISLAAVVIAPLNFVRSFGYSGMATAAMAGIGAIVTLPAVLAVLGHNVNRWTVWSRSTRPPSGDGVWHRVAVAAMRRPVVVAAVVIVAMLVVASPVLHFRPGLIDDRDLSANTGARRVGDMLRSDFTGREGTPMPVVLLGVDARRNAESVGAFASAVASLPDVTRVDTATGSYIRGVWTPPAGAAAARYSRPTATYLDVVTSTEPLSSGSEGLIRAIRKLPAPGSQVLVTGEAAVAYDVKTAILRFLPAALLFIALATMVALFLQFGSILVPLKAVALNTLSLCSLMGILVWVFQDGHLDGLLGTTATGSLYINVLLFIFVLAFGLSMDYEVFLLSRIKEEYDRTADNEAAVAMGLERSGRIVSAAAVLIALVFVASAIGSTTKFSLAFGYGLGLIVLGDAFVIRGTLVPALMKLAGAANWWAPRPLRRLHDRIGLSETETGATRRAPV